MTFVTKVQTNATAAGHATAKQLQQGSTTKTKKTAEVISGSGLWTNHSHLYLPKETQTEELTETV